MPVQKRREDVFLVRVWREPHEERPAEWRGSAFHATSGRRFYFSDLETLRRYIASELGEGDAAEAPC